MQKEVNTGLSFSSKLIMLFIILLCLSSLIIGFTGYFVARTGLNRKGEQILKNSVVQAIEFIESEHSKVKSGIASEEETSEHIKITLLGPLEKDSGIRTLHQNIDLGENGYLLIYDSAGNEIMHPTLEGRNVLDVTSFDDEDLYLVREQIRIAKNGGGFTNYSWMLPHSDKISRKISYSNYYEPWDWIVVATAYTIDFNRTANIILLVIILTMSVLIIAVSFIIVRYVRKITTPIIEIARGMAMVTLNEYTPVKKNSHKDEIGVLIDGYNNMIKSLQEAEENIAEKDDHIRFLAFHDDLTGLPNRHGLEAFVQGRIKNECKSAFMVQGDIVGLKVINSTLGYKEGDRIIKVIGNYFSKIKSPELYLSRTSSNEFTMWVENRNHRQIRNFIYQLRNDVKKHLIESGFSEIIDIHLAMANYPENGSNFGALYEKASMAMKIAKDSRDLEISEYNDIIRETIENEVSMKRYLSKALEENEITAYYQAQVDYKTGITSGVEALARWDSKELGFVPPSVFIPAIDSQNLVNDFSRYMLELVLADYSNLKKKYNDEITVSINISPSYFMYNDFIENLHVLLKKYSVPAGKTTLEVTEDVFISDFESVASVIEQLHEMGVRISIDDFGTGYSSLNYLTRINFDEMKIDKSFISRILDEPRSMKLFEVLCRIAEIYDYDIVAEGVENTEQLEMIKATSLRIIQGYLFSKPEPLPGS